MPAAGATRAKTPPATSAEPGAGGVGWQAALRRPWVVGLCLALVTLAVFLPVAWQGFVNYDDSDYVTENTHVQGGLTWENVGWAFTTGHASNWHPLTWLSHMLDYQLFGLWGGGHHLVSVGLHIANTLLLFLLLRGLTGAHWRSALVAAWFALHPLHVESVAWASERKDVLSALFFLLTLLAYARYAEGRGLESGVLGPESGRGDAGGAPRAVRFYVVALVCFALGLMSKPMLVTVPFVLLLLDYWPLMRVRSAECGVRSAEDRRLGEEPRMEPGWNTDGGREKAAAEARSGKAGDTQHATRGAGESPIANRQLPIANRESQMLLWLVLEKVPFFLLAAGSSVITFIVQRKGGAVSTALSLDERTANALVSYVRYLGNMFWPENLSVLYPHPGHWPVWQVIASGALLLAITAAAVLLARRRPYLGVGWFWFCGMLIPVIGLVQVGIQSMADRYTYLPLIGLFIMVAWGLNDAIPAGRAWRAKVLPLAAGLSVAACACLTVRQVGIWRDSEALFTRAVQVTRSNYLAYNNLGFYLNGRGRTAEAMENYRMALKINPNYEDALNNLGYALAGQKKFAEAIPLYEAALRIRPNHAEVHNNLGNALSELGRVDEAIGHYLVALKQKPQHADAHNNLGIALAMKGRLEEAIPHFQDAIRYKPNYASAHSNLGNAYAVQHKLDEAIREYQTALRLKPGDAQAHNNLGNALAEQGKVEEAIGHYKEALRLNADNPEAHFNLALALLRQGKREEGVVHLTEALRLKPDYAEAQRQLSEVRGAR